jgi:hypothetical protein
VGEGEGATYLELAAALDVEGDPCDDPVVQAVRSGFGRPDLDVVRRLQLMGHDSEGSNRGW